MAMEIKLPELGDGIESGDVLEVLVAEGDVIEREQGIIEIETDKATAEVPSTHAGKVLALHVSVGQTIPVGATLISLEPAESSAPTAPSAPTAATSEPKSEPKSEPLLPEPTPVPLPPNTPSAPIDAPAAVPPVPAPATPPVEPPLPAAEPLRSGPARGDSTAPAGPAVRRTARELGVDLRQVTGTGPRGRITRDDVEAAAKKAESHTPDTETTPGAAATPPSPLPGHEVVANDAFGPVLVERMTRIRKTIAAKMHQSWTTVPHVTNFDDADITELEQLRQAGKADYAAAGVKLTAMPFLIKAVALALRSHPTVNASLDGETGHAVYKQYVNIGIAVDTERGLVVPVIRDVDRLSIPELARELARLAEKVRANDFAIDDLRGGTFTISNLGAVGGKYSTPIINTPEVAILLAGRSRKMPMAVDGKIALRTMMPLSLSYDHRLVDGADAGRFLNDVIAYLKAPSRMLLAP